ncbi:MAG: Ig-like domain-containing protein [Candidatus Hydrogenedentales bacterium]
MGLNGGGEVYVSGEFPSTVDFDPGAGTLSLAAVGGTDIFVMKLNGSGNFVWAKQMGGNSTETAWAMAVAEDGDVYTTGYFMGTVDFDPGTATANHTATSQDLFVSKLDSSGEFIWAKQMGGNASYGWSVAIDLSQNVYTTGYFFGSIDFDPGVGSAILTSSTIDIFVAKLTGPPPPPVISAPNAGADYSTTSTSSVVISGTCDATTTSIHVNGSASGVTYTSGNTTWSYTSGTLANGANLFSVTALDGVGESAADTITITVDTTPPTVAITSTATDPTHIAPIPVTVTFSEPVTGFTIGDLTIGNGNAGNFAGSGDTYTFDLTPTGLGLVTVSVGGGVSVDAALNANTASPAFSITYADLNGNSSLQHAVTFGDTSGDRGLGVYSDASGNVYACGFFQGTIDLDPGAGVSNLTATSAEDAYVAKYDATGALVWKQQIYGNGSQSANAVTADGSGNVYVCGTADTSVNVQSGVTTFSTAVSSHFDSFVVKFDSAGAHQWVKVYGGGGGGDYVSAFQVALDSGGNILLGGYFSSGVVDFDPGAGTVTAPYVANVDAYVLKLDSTGAFVWVKSAGGASGDIVRGLVVDASDNVVTSGQFRNTVDFDPSGSTVNLSSAGGDDTFVWVLSSGGTLVFAKRVGGTADEVPMEVAVSANGNIVTTGGFSGTTDFDPGAGTANMTAVGNKDAYVLVLDSSGNFVLAEQFGGTLDEQGKAITTDSSNSIYVTGEYQDTADFDPSVASYTLTAAGLNDVFVVKLQATGELAYAKSLSGTVDETGNDIAVSSGTRAVAVTGEFAGTVDFDPGAGVDNRTSAGGGDAYLVVLAGPTVTLTTTESDPTSATAIPVTVNFDTAVTGFVAGDISLTNASVANFAGSGSTFTFDLIPAGAGVVGADVAAGVAQDTLGDPNLASNTLSLTYVPVPPTITLSSSDPDPANAAITVTATLDQPSVNFVSGDVTATNATVSGFSGSGTSYSFALTPIAQGTFSAEVLAGAFTDGIGNGNVASNVVSRTYDSVGPTVALTSTATDPTNTSPIPVTVTFNESVTGFAVGDLVIANGSANNFAGGPSVYTFDLIPGSQGIVTVDVQAGVAADAAGNPNTAATQFARDYDSASPTVSITSTETSPTNTSPIPVTVTFSKNVTGFATGDIAVTNGTKSNFVAATQAVYTFDLTPSGQGSVGADIAAAVCTSTAGNPNQPGSFSITYDGVGPNVTLATTASSPTNVTPIPVTVTFNESVADFVSTDVVAINGTVANFAGSGANYSFDLVPSGAGLVSANVAGSEAHDAAGNGSNVSNTVSRTYDNVLPIIALLGSDPVQIEQYTAYADAGATASDNNDGDITANIVVDTSNVDVNTISFYTVTYDVTDAAGNSATQATRTVEVVAASTNLPIAPWLVAAALLLAGAFTSARRKSSTAH